MRESSIEHRFVNRVKKAGGLCWKFTAPGISGVPDRIVMLPPGRIFFVELKRQGGIVSDVQKTRLQELTARNINARVCIGVEGIEEFFRDVGI